ncbi:MAG: long-chain-fatty-acid--CoA ligase [Deltaproteobacteria bacterium]|nr:long-chain-fatty-acid--CoA ligase [Deltaproteobacteria bacterium]
MMLIGDIIRREARIRSQKIAVVEGEKEFTYQEVNQRVNRLANTLLKIGVVKGDKIAFMGNTSHQFMEFYFATAKIGSIAVPINARFSSDEAEYVLKKAEVKLLIYNEDMEETVQKLRSNISGITQFVSTGNTGHDVLFYEEFISNESDIDPNQVVGPDDIAIIMFTSGATGFPKGVIATQRNIMANTNTMCLELDLGPEDISLLAMPLYHIGGLWPMLSMVYRGGTSILIPRFDLEPMFEMIQKRKVTFINLVPTVLLRIISHPNILSYNLESIRLIMHAAAPIPREQLKNAMKVFGPHRLTTGLGSTEANGALIHFRSSEHALEGPMVSKLGSVGKDAMGVEIAIVDEEGREVPNGEPGEIIGKGDNIAPSYWKLPKESAESFRDGWLYTGDIGYRDQDGYIYIVDRKKDIIISGGENVASREVEEVLHQHPSVYEAAVIGVPDNEWGEGVKAVIVLKGEFVGKVDDKELMEFCRSRLAGYKRPRSIDFVAELPKNAAGKIDKVILKNHYKKLYEEMGIKSALG